MSFVYIIFVCLAIYFSFRYDGIEVEDSRKKHRLWMMAIYLICLSGFSYGLGADKFAYLEFFEDYPNDLHDIGDYLFFRLLAFGEMPLWVIINLLCKVFFNSFYPVQFIESTAINISICYLVTKYTHRYFLFLLIYFFSLQYFIFNTEVMREGFALAFILIGMHFYMTGRKWFFWLSLPIGILFHVSAAIAIIFPFVSFKISWKTLLYTTIITFIVWILSDIILTRVVSMVFGSSGALAQKAIFYSMQSSTFFGYLRATFTYLIIPFIITYSVVLTETDESIRKRKEKLISYLVVLAIMSCSFAGFVRFYNYVQAFYLIMMADFVYMLFRVKEHLIIRLGTFVSYSILIFVFLYMVQYQSTNSYFYEYFYPYTCILDEDADIYYRKVAHQEAVTFEVGDNNVRNIE